jgi:hypothetical protein
MIPDDSNDMSKAPPPTASGSGTRKRKAEGKSVEIIPDDCEDAASRPPAKRVQFSNMPPLHGPHPMRQFVAARLGLVSMALAAMKQGLEVTQAELKEMRSLAQPCTGGSS